VSDPQTTLVESTDGVTVAVHDLGGSGPTLVLCHATGFHGRVWLPVAAALADRFHCLAVDFRGHGDSIIPDGLDLHWSGMGEDLLAVVDHLDLGTGLLGAGWSMGGCALTLAELGRPGLWQRAWAMEPIIFPTATEIPTTPSGGSALAEGARRRREVFDSRDHAFENYASKPPFAWCDPRALRAYVDYGFADQDDGTVILKCRGEIEGQVFEASLSGAWERLEEFAAPFTVVASGDGNAPATVAPAVVDRLPQGRLETMDDLTHFAPIQDPERVAESIAAALGQG
jgi:pimeloyl-ACP methyl ester carboxylesterase